MRKKVFLNVKEAKSKVTTLLLTGLMCCPMMSLAQNLQINVSDAQFTRQMMERLIKEYNKVNPEFTATVVDTREKADASVSLSGQDDVNSIGRFAILPIANSENELLRNKKVVKGLSNKLKHQIFVERDLLEELDAEEEGEKQLPGTVYSLTGSHAITTTLVARDLSITPNRVKGKKILGSEENLISAVRSHQDAIAFNVASLAYDSNTYQPVEGLTVLATDLDGNGRISDEERSVISSLDKLTDYLDKLPHTGLPIGNISIKTDNQELRRFVDWASTEGQGYLSPYGFLKANKALTAQK
ncbi:hypothetical protein SAMN04487902_11074 [Prevotella sp. ne3005]|jgi:hypothetical protein|uniref:hypothetical protein n=1 Tax=Prevotella sp. ne3005 TaxID=1761887 RepID=UPI0008C90FA0|nr:hypothetical protein [Prevotella sp. ne3005]SEN27897.1 hypothetical protein SAMN04487902_11074 [Prevotella sp. ne3005]